jgi:hypothetical protein
MVKRNTNRRHMIGDHHGRTAGEQLCWSGPWTRFSARTLLQVRTRALNDDVADDFGRWYPGFTHTSDATLDDQPAAA